MLNNLNPSIAIVDLGREIEKPFQPTSCLY